MFFQKSVVLIVKINLKIAIDLLNNLLCFFYCCLHVFWICLFACLFCQKCIYIKLWTWSLIQECIHLEQDVAKHLPMKQNSGNDSSLESQMETSPFFCLAFKRSDWWRKGKTQNINVQYLCLKGKTEMYYTFRL